ncbi:unnamed protein product [Didymodactylos carnosus]|uniref:Uncharacterized protein n=2 Tax=Didymodactylos carnosus TaxID=1234261 RepID=A0A8S2D2I3_9BILA|nr:unnamed protein product [Didymodactylos carnosus]CAF3610545.1 unnamed protein product [Didymodactylos carnosus]
MTLLLLQCALLVTLMSTYSNADYGDSYRTASRQNADYSGLLNDRNIKTQVSSSFVGRPIAFDTVRRSNVAMTPQYGFAAKDEMRPSSGYAQSRVLNFDNERRTLPTTGYGQISVMSFDEKPIVPQGPSPCSSAAIGQRLPNPADRSSYIVCLDKIRYEVMSCPIELVFNDVLDQCERVTDEEAVCRENPCMNGGQCYATSPQTFKCTCLEAFTGERCEVPIGSCAKQPCGPDAECWTLRAEDYPQDYVCLCNSRRSYGLSCSQTVPDPCSEESRELVQYYPFAFSKQAYVQCNGEITHFRPCPSGLLWSQEEKACRWPEMPTQQQDYVSLQRVNTYQQRPQYDRSISQNTYGSQFSAPSIDRRQQNDVTSQSSYQQQPINTYGSSQVFDVKEQQFLDQQRRRHKHHHSHTQKQRLFGDVTSSYANHNQQQEAYFQKQQVQPVSSVALDINTYRSQPSSSYGTSNLLGQNAQSDMVSARRVNSGLFNSQSLPLVRKQSEYRRKRQYGSQVQPLADITIQQPLVSSGYGSSSQLKQRDMRLSSDLVGPSISQYGSQQSYGGSQVQPLADITIQQPIVSSGYGSSSQLKQRDMRLSSDLVGPSISQYGSQSYGGSQVQPLADITIQQPIVSSGYGSSSQFRQSDMRLSNDFVRPLKSQYSGQIQKQLDITPQSSGYGSSMLKVNVQNDRPMTQLIQSSYQQQPMNTLGYSNQQIVGGGLMEQQVRVQLTLADQICDGQRPETVIPHPATTRKFIVCLDSSKGAELSCPDGLHYSTVTARCERKPGQTESPCALNPCLNGGRCVEEGSSYRCDCPQGIGGTQCELDVSACLQNPCGQGQCQSFRFGAALTYVCICQGDTYGPNCQQTLPNPCREDDTLPLGFTDKGFIICDSNRFFVETCPGGLIWNNGEKACAWPGVQIQLQDQSDYYSKGNIQVQLASNSYSAPQYSNQRPSLDLSSQRNSGYGEKLLIREQPLHKRKHHKQKLVDDVTSYSSQQPVPTSELSYSGRQIQPLADITIQQPIVSSGYGSSSQLKQRDMRLSSDLVGPSVSQYGSQQSYGSSQVQPLADITIQQPIVSSGYGSSSQLKQSDMRLSSDLVGPSISQYGSQQSYSGSQVQPLADITIQQPIVSSGYGSSSQLKQSDMRLSSDLVQQQRLPSVPQGLSTSQESPITGYGK